jgi:putative tricarboxylic transport membrane protein
VRKNVLAGLLFIVVAAAGLWLSRDYNIGTLRRMGAGYMPQLLCWLLMGLGAIVLVQGLLGRGGTILERGEEFDGVDLPPQNLWAVALVGLSLVGFALTIERAGLIVAVGVLIAIASFAYRGLRWWETLLTAIFMAALSWAVFVLGLGMTMKVLPEGLPWTF